MTDRQASTPVAIQYKIDFGLARNRVLLGAEESKRLNEHVQDTLMEAFSAVWGVSAETYKSKISLSSKPWMMNARSDTTNDADLRMIQSLVPDSVYRILTFLYEHNSASECKRARPIQDMLLQEDPTVLEQYLRRLRNATIQCLVVNQLFENSSVEGTHNVMPEAFFYALRHLMPSRLDDDAACCQFASQFLLMVHVLSNEFCRAVRCLYPQIHKYTFRYEGGWSLEFPSFLWQYKSPSDNNTSSQEKSVQEEFYKLVYDTKKEDDQTQGIINFIWHMIQQDESESTRNDDDTPGEPTNNDE